MITKLILTPDEAALNGEAVLLRLMDEQPPEGTKLIENNCSFYFALPGKYQADPMMWKPIDCPYPLNTPLGIRETWGIMEYEEYDRIIYKSDIPKSSDLWDRLDIRRSPATMPADAIRRWFTISEIDCKQVQKITIQEITQILGILFKDAQWAYLAPPSEGNPFKIHWNTAHAKPVKSGDGYVCYPYSVESWLKEYRHHTMSKDGSVGKLLYGKYADGDKINMTMWKGKPLTIYPNAWLFVLKGEIHGN